MHAGETLDAASRATAMLSYYHTIVHGGGLGRAVLGRATLLAMAADYDRIMLQGFTVSVPKLSSVVIQEIGKNGKPPTTRPRLLWSMATAEAGAALPARGAGALGGGSPWTPCSE